MALSNLSLTLISISALLFSSLYVEATFYVEPEAASAPAPAPVASVQVGSASIFANPAELSLPDFYQSSEDVSVDQQAKAAKVVAKQMQQVESKIAEFNAILHRRLQDPETSEMTQECIKECDEVYSAAQDDIKKSLDSLDSKDLTKANFDISAVSTDVDTCYECFQEMIGEDPELKKFDEWVRGITGEALETLEKVES